MVDSVAIHDAIQIPIQHAIHARSSWIALDRLGFLERLGRRSRCDPADPENDPVPVVSSMQIHLPSSNRANQNLKLRFEALQSNLKFAVPVHNFRTGAFDTCMQPRVLAKINLDTRKSILAALFHLAREVSDENTTIVNRVILVCHRIQGKLSAEGVSGPERR